MAQYQISGPDGAVYNVDGPDGADPSAVIGAIHGQASLPANAPQGALGQIALAGRDVGEGVFDTLMAPRDIGTSLVNLERRGVNRLFGTHLAPSPMYSARLSDALTQGGAPVASTPGEQLAASGIRGTAGALTGLGLLSPLGVASTVPNALRAGASGLTGGASSDLAREAGAGPVGQFAAGLAGGLAPSALEGGVGTMGSVARPFTRAGQTQLAANVLRTGATNPTQAALNLSSASTLVPGSLRTAGEASGDTGLLALEKGIRARNPGAFGERISQQNAARQAQLAQLGGTPADIAQAEAARDATTAPMRQNAFATGMGRVPVPTSTVHDTIDSLLKSPAGARESIAKTLNWAKGLIGDHNDPETLYEVRKDLALAQQGKLQPSSPDAPNASTLAHARGQLGQVIGSLDDAIDSAAPGYKAYLAKYRDLSEPINQMEAIQGLQQKASSGLDTATGEPFLSAPQFSRQLPGVLQNAKFSPAQSQGLTALREDLQRGSALSSPTVRAPGSDTFQNFMLSQRLKGFGNFAGHIPLVGKMVRSIGDLVDQRVNAQLSNAMLNPQMAATLLQRGTTPLPLSFALRRALRGGALPGLSAPLIGPNPGKP